MRIFLRFSVGLFRHKTERLELQPQSTSDELLQTVSLRLGKPMHMFTLTYTQQQIRIRIVKGWPLAHYNLRSGVTLLAETTDQQYQLPQDSFKTNKLLASVLSEISPMELSRIEEVSEEHAKESVIGGEPVGELDDEAILRNYLDQELELLVKEVRKGNLQAVKSILTDCSALNYKPHLQSKATHHKSNTFINQLAENGWAAIHVSSYYQHPQILDYLLNHNANPNIWTSDGWTALQLAVSKRSINCLRMLLKCPRTNVNEMTPKGTALHVAVRMDFADMVKELLQNKANQHLKDQNGEMAAELGDSEEVKKLLRREHEEHKKEEVVHGRQFLLELPPILKGQVFRQNTLYQMKPLFLVCNPFEGTLIRFESELAYPLHPKQLIPLSSINQIKILPISEISWLMSKHYFYFQVFYQNRLILGVRHQKIARRWVKGIFQASAFSISNEVKHQKDRVDQKGFPTLILDDVKNIVGDPEVEIRKKAGSASPVKKKNGGSMLLRELSTRSQRKEEEIQKEKEPMVRSFTLSTMPFKQQPQPEDINGPQPQFIEQEVRDFKKRKVSEYELNKSSIQSKNQNTQPQEPQKKEESFQLKTRSNKTTTTTMISQIQEQPAFKVKFSSFELLRELGANSAGKVFQARLKTTNQVFTLKALHKKSSQRTPKLQKSSSSSSQSQILQQLEHPFIVKLHHTFQTINNTYLCLDQTQGDLSQLIAQHQTMSQLDSVAITAQILLAIQYLHSKNIVYRNLKPQSILLTEQGFIKLSDFGFSKEVDERNRCTTFCGSLAYVSPEMLLRQEVGKHSDVYGVGCVLYQMLTGEPPYFDGDSQRLQENICQGRLKFKGVISSVAKQLILKLLQRDISKRITIAEAKKHPFFKDIDFTKLLEKKQGQINFSRRQFIQSDDDQCQIKNPRPKFHDTDYPQAKSKALPKIS